MTARRDDGSGEYASPACFAHEQEREHGHEHRHGHEHGHGQEPAPHGGDPQGQAEVLRWRKAERERLIAARLATPAEDRRRFSVLIETFLEGAIGNVSGLTVSAYSPFRGEPAVRDLMKSIIAHGGRTALPVVLAPRTPLIFRLWSPGDPTERGVWDIPVPSARAEVVLPDVVIAPVVGFDSACFRLGYGGGFFDRTLASFAKRPRVFGVGYSQAAIHTIHPLPHDIAMDAIVTERGVLRRENSSAP